MPGNAKRPADPDQELKDRIAELEEQIAPLAAELAQLQQKLNARIAGRKSALARQEAARLRDAAVLQEALSRWDDKYRRNGGLNRSLAREHGLSERTVYTILRKAKAKKD